MGLFGLLNKKINKSKQETEIIKAVPSAVREDESATISLYFEDLSEFMAYVAIHPKENVVWLSDYCDLVKKGSLLNEQQNYTEAIRVLQKAIELKNDGINARFEIIYSYQRVNDIRRGYEILLSMTNDLKTNKQKAMYYRLLGYCQTEFQNYKAAAACYLYSRNFEDHPVVTGELAYIFQFSGPLKIENPLKILKDYRLPVIQ